MWEGVGIELPDDQLLIPDLTIADSGCPNTDGLLLNPVDVLLVAEIVSKGSTKKDRILKPELYAEAGIPYYWRIELENFRGRQHPLPVILVYELCGIAEYKITQVCGAGSTLRVKEPFPIELDPGSLIDD